MFSKAEFERLQKMAAEAPMQRRIEAVQSVEDLGAFIAFLRADQADCVNGVNLDGFMEALLTVCARARAHRKEWGNELSEPPAWSDFADLLYTALVYE